MINRTPTTDIIESIVNLLSFDYAITSVTDNLDGTYTLTSNNTYHLQPTFVVSIDSVDYTVVSVVRNTNIVVSGTVLPTATSFTVYTPYYFHGTPVQVSNELTEINVSSEKTPMVYLSEALKEKYFGRGSAIDRTTNCRLFFLTQCETSWLTERFHSDAIQPMTDLANEFIEKLRASKLIGNFEENGYEITTLQRVSIETSGKGKKNFANECLSGVELNIELPIVRGNNMCPPTIIVVPTGYTWEQLSLITWEQMSLLTWEYISS
jgi:hypothetical protein